MAITVTQPIDMSGNTLVVNSIIGGALVAGTNTGTGIYFGAGAPTFTAAANSLYLRTDGSTTTTRMYVNTTGSTTWATVTTSA